MRRQPTMSENAKGRERNARTGGEFVNHALYLFYLCAVVTVFGAASSNFGFFPGRQLNSLFSVFDDVRALISLHWEYRVEKRHPNEIAWPKDYPAWPDIQPKIGADELTLVQAYRNGVYGLFLVDAQGRINREWRMPPELDADLVKSSDRLMPGVFKVIDGAHLYPNGDVVFTVDYYGVAKVDRCSRKIWSLPGEYHHSLSIDRNGDLWIPFREFQRSGGASKAWISGPFHNESVARISPDGERRELFSLVDAAIDARFEGLIAEGSPDVSKTVASDITHLNDADIVTAEFAAANPPLREGDIMVSMRTLDAIAVIDRQTRRFKFALSGMTLRQHDPDALANGNIVVLDNRTRKSQHNGLHYLPQGQSFGWSRIVEINPRTQEIAWSWEGAKDRPFFSSIQGKIEPQPNGNILVAEPEGGRAFEIDRATGEIVWQFANLLETRDGVPVYGRVTGATRYQRSDLSFLDDAACPAL